MDLMADARKVADHVFSLEGFRIENRARTTYGHMGAIISDGVLQAGLNYENVVAPKVRDLIDRCPEAETTTGFLDAMISNRLLDLLNWAHPEKPRRIMAVTSLLHGLRVDTEGTFRDWLATPGSGAHLMQVRGVGPKTVDYFKMLVGLPSIPVDRHVRAFVSSAGVDRKRYEDVQQVIVLAADLLRVERNAFDRAIWSRAAAMSRSRAAPYVV